MIPLKCSASDCFNFPSHSYIVNGQEIVRCQHHPMTCCVKGCYEKPKVQYQHKNKKLTYCKHHSREYQILICQHTHCNSLAGYGYNDNNKAICCIKHRTDGMVIIGDYCLFLGCHSPATHNTVGRFNDQLKGLYCHIHKKKNMVSLQEYKDGFKTKIVSAPEPLSKEDVYEIIYNFNKKNDIDDIMKSYDIINIPIV